MRLRPCRGTLRTAPASGSTRRSYNNSIEENTAYQEEYIGEVKTFTFQVGFGLVNQFLKVIIITLKIRSRKWTTDYYYRLTVLALTRYKH